MQIKLLFLGMFLATSSLYSLHNHKFTIDNQTNECLIVKVEHSGLSSSGVSMFNCFDNKVSIVSLDHGRIEKILVKKVGDTEWNEPRWLPRSLLGLRDSHTVLLVEYGSKGKMRLGVSKI